MLDDPSPYILLSDKTVDDFVKESDVKEFFMETIDTLLENYEPGRLEHKPEVLKQIQDLKNKREEMMETHRKMQQQQLMNANPLELANAYEKKLSEQTIIINSLIQENNKLKEKNEYLDKKMNELINKTIQEKMKMKMKNIIADANVDANVDADKDANTIFI